MEATQTEQPAISFEFDESALRRPEFQPGRPVLLADGQLWSIPNPDLAYAPTFGPDGGVGSELVSVYGPGFDQKVQAVRDAQATQEIVVSLFGLATDLLGRNYDLTPDHYRALLRYRFNQPDDNASLWEFFLVAIGSPAQAMPEVEAAG